MCWGVGSAAPVKIDCVSEGTSTITKCTGYMSTDPYVSNLVVRTKLAKKVKKRFPETRPLK